MTSNVLLCLLLWACCVGVMYAQSGFMQDGAIEQLIFAQTAVVNTPDEASLIAIKYETATVLLDVRKKVDLFTSLKASKENDGSCISYSNSKLRVLLLGNRADTLTAKVLCSELDSNTRMSEGIELSAARMSLLLADEAQRCSMELSATRQLAFNALVVNTDRTVHSNKFGDLHKVDVSGNFQKCKAVCIGAKEGRINSWLGTRGRFIASRLANVGRNAPSTQPVPDINIASTADNCNDFSSTEKDNNNSNASANNATEKCDMESCFNISACCLLENYLADALYSGNYSVSVSVLQQGADLGNREAGSIVGPVTVPLAVLRGLVNGSCCTDTSWDTSILAAATPATEVTTEARPSLFHWWRALHPRPVSRSTSTMTIGGVTSVLCM